MDSIIEQIYDAALDQQAWPALLTDIAAAIGAVAGFYAGLDTRHGRGAWWHVHGHDTALQALYNQRYLDIDPTLAHIVRVPGTAFACTDYLGEAKIAASDFHTGFLIPHGLRYVLSGVVSMRGSLMSFFGFQRALGQAPFSAADTAFMQRLIPHLAKADQVALRLSSMSAARTLAAAALDRLDYGILIVDGDGNLRLTNQRAEQWLEQADILHSHFGRLRLAGAAGREALPVLLRAAAAGEAAGRQLQSAGGATVKVIALPLNHEQRIGLDDQQARVMVVVSDDRQQRVMAPRMLQEAYGLTSAETRVAVALAGGLTQEETGASLFVSLATVKTHTQHIFRKTGVCRQTELIRLIYGLPALL
ncbi:helix-turn-helix transcriptional regulator [Oxalobacteraceae bacterium A2-2]